MAETTGPTTQPHEWYQELLGAYALGAQSPEERAALEAHLATCLVCQEELTLLRIGARAMALTAGEQDPSPELRNRVWEAIRAEPNVDRTQTLVAQGPQATRPGAMPTSIREARSARKATRLPLLTMIAATLAIVLIGSLLAWNVSLRSTRLDLAATVTAVAQQPGDVRTVGQLGPTSQGGAGGGEVQYLSNRSVMLISLHDLPPLPEGQVYQLWLIVGDQVNPSIVFETNPNPAEPTTIAVSADPNQLDALAITREPGPIGSAAPTIDPILVAEI